MYKHSSRRLLAYFFPVIFIAFAATQNVLAANLVSTVDRQQISENETLNLTVTLDDASFSGSPDLAGLETNFQLLDSRSASSTSIVNGSYSSRKEWHYTLLPIKTGKLLIPSFKLKNIFSDAIEIEVLPAGANRNNRSGNANADNQGDLYLEQKIDKTDAYVQEAMTLTLHIFTAVQIARPEIPDPSLPNFMVEKLGQAEYQTRQNGRNYFVLEYKYGLFPNKSGKVVLPKQRYQINQIIDNNGPRSFFDLQGPVSQARFLTTQELTLNIKAQPDNNPASYWLPSEDVSITDNWPEQQTVEVGAPLTRNIEIKALGNLAAHIPPLSALNINGLKSYAEQPALTNSHAADHFLGVRKENIAIVPTQAGTYILPAISLHWWNTKTREFKTATLPERTLTVKGAAGVVPSSPAQTPMMTPQAVQQNPTMTVGPSGTSLIGPRLDNVSPSAVKPIYMNVYVWMGAAVFFAVLWIATLLVMLKRKNTAGSGTLPAAELLRQQSLKAAFKQLLSACEGNDAKLARSALIHWAQWQWPHVSISTLQQVKQQIHNDSLNELVDELDGTLYRESTSWNGKLLYTLLQSGKFTVASGNQEATLPGLYT